MKRYACSIDTFIPFKTRQFNGNLSCRRKFPLYISQDGKVPKAAVANLAKSYADRGIRYLHHREEAPPIRLLNRRENLAYYRIANHYKFILQTFFECFGYSRLIILEVRFSLNFIDICNLVSKCCITSGCGFPSVSFCSNFDIT